MARLKRRGLKKFGLRKCLRCREIFPLDNQNFFRNNSRGTSGLDWFCKECHKIKNRKYYKNSLLKNRFEFLKKNNFTCIYCGRRAPFVELQIDHIMPTSLVDDWEESNLVLACVDCNLGKGDKLIQ